MTFKFIEIENEGAVRRIWLNRPEKRNAQSQELLQELDDAFVAADRDASVRAVILAGRGAHFSAGHDLDDAPRFVAGSIEDHYDYEARFYIEYCLRIWDLRKPVIAQVQGAAVAGGFMIANVCDLIVASDDAYFADPVVQTMASAATEILSHPYTMGLRRAKEFLYLGEKMGAEEAYRIGMVNKVVPKEKLAEEAMAMAQRIASGAPFAMQLLKRSLNRSADMQGFRNAVQSHFDTHMFGHTTQGFRTLISDGMKTALAKNKSVA